VRSRESGLHGPDQLRWPPCHDGLARLLDGESNSRELGAHHGRIDVGELESMLTSARSEPFMVLMGWVIEVLIDDHQATTLAQYPPDLGDRRIEVALVVHRVDCPGGIDTAIRHWEMLGHAVEDLDARAGTLPEPTHTEDKPHERRGSTATTRAPAWAASTAPGPIPAPTSRTRSSARMPSNVITSRFTGDVHILLEHRR